MSLLRAVTVAVLLCSVAAVDDGLSTSGVRVTVYADTILEADGHSAIPPLFGIISDGSVTVDTEQWIRHFKQLHVDTVGLSQTLGDILPDSLPDLTVSGLQYWLMSGRAFQLYQQSSQYFYLNSRLAQQAGARPLLFLRNPDGWCEPPCQQAYCWMRGGTPRVHSQWHDNYRNHMFDWWALLFAGNLDLALKADPSLRMVHIWNEPDIHFPMDGKNGSYYADFFAAVASRIKNSWPEILLGGPVTSNLPTRPFSESVHSTWTEYIQPLIDRTASQNLLDFIDFHADSSSATLADLLSSIETTVSYALIKYGSFLPVALTELKFRVNTSTTVANTSPSLYHSSCTFPLLLNTFTLFKYPDKVIGRLLANKRGTGNCQSLRSDYQPTPESNVYYLLGKLSNGTRIRVSVSGHPSDTSCQCKERVTAGNSAVMGEAVLFEQNMTIALLNLCDCKMTVTMSIRGTQLAAAVASWAAVLDENLLSSDQPVPLNQGTQQITIPALGLYVASYYLASQYSEPNQPTDHYDVTRRPLNSNIQVYLYGDTQLKGAQPQLIKTIQGGALLHNKLGKVPQRVLKSTRDQSLDPQRLNNFRPFPVELAQVFQLSTAHPINSKWLMRSLPSPMPPGYSFTIPYNMGRVLDLQPYKAVLRVGFLGVAAEMNWTVTYKCSTDSSIAHTGHSHIHHHHHHNQVHTHSHKGHHNHHHKPFCKNSHKDFNQNSKLETATSTSGKCQVKLLSPGSYSELELPQMPSHDQYGYARLTFKCTTTSQNSNGSMSKNHQLFPDSYLAFSSIVLHSLNNLIR